MYNTPKYTEQGGAKTVIGGEIEITGTLTVATGATVTGTVSAAVVNNLTTTETGSALDAAQGKALKTAVDAKYTAANATTAAAGLVKKAVNVPVAASVAPTKEEFDALINALVTAGIITAAE